MGIRDGMCVVPSMVDSALLRAMAVAVHGALQYTVLFPQAAMGSALSHPCVNDAAATVKKSVPSVIAALGQITAGLPFPGAAVLGGSCSGARPSTQRASVGVNCWTR